MAHKKMLILLLLSVLLLIAASDTYRIKRVICEGNELKDAIYDACGFSPSRSYAIEEEEKARSHHHRRLFINHAGQHNRRHHRRNDIRLIEKILKNRLTEMQSDLIVPTLLREKCCDPGCTIFDLLNACFS